MPTGYDIAAQLTAAYRAQATQVIMEQYKQTVSGATRAIFQRELEEQQYQLRLFAWKAEVNQGFNRRVIKSQLKKNVDEGVNFAVSLSNRDVIQAAAHGANQDVAQTIGIIGRVYRQAVDNKWIQVSKINRQVANQAIADMLKRYDEVHKQRPRGSSNAPYRQNERFTGGLLRAALASPLQAQATVDGVTFLNTSLLDATAKQWARLNFGAGPRAGARRGQSGSSYSLLSRGDRRFSATSEFFESAVGESLPAFNTKLPYSPKGAFYMPTGIFLEGTKTVPANRARKGQDAFLTFDGLSDASKRKVAFSSGLSKKKLTQGVAAWGFIEAGVESLAYNLPRANRAFMLQIFRESQAQVGAGLPAKLAITPTQVGAAITILERTKSNLLASSGIQ